MNMFFKKRTSAEKMYAVLLHAKHLHIMSDGGVESIGGAYTWRYVAAPDEQQAGQAAIRSLLQAPAFMREVLNISEALTDVSVEEIVAISHTDARGSGVSFYIEEKDNVEPEIKQPSEDGEGLRDHDKSQDPDDQTS